LRSWISKGSARRPAEKDQTSSPILLQIRKMLTPTRKTPLQGLELSPPVGPSGLATSRVVEHGQLVYSIDVAKKFSRQMAHDFNNILAVIQGFAAILQSRLQQDEANRVLAEQIDASAMKP
jgi:signal transduction histidine kinase